MSGPTTPQRATGLSTSSLSARSSLLFLVVGVTLVSMSSLEILRTLFDGYVAATGMILILLALLLSPRSSSVELLRLLESFPRVDPKDFGTLLTRVSEIESFLEEETSQASTTTGRGTPTNPDWPHY